MALLFFVSYGLVGIGFGTAGIAAAAKPVYDDILVYENGEVFVSYTEQEHRFPVYDNPFGIPSAPGQWTMPGDFGQPGGRQGFMSGKAFYRRMAAVQQTTAVAGIDMNIEDAWSVYNGGSREVVVALIDTGIDDTHEDLQGAI